MRRGTRRDGFTLIELLVVIAIIALLVSILLPSLRQAKELAQRMRCLANMHTVSLANFLYGSDHGVIPGEYGIIIGESLWGIGDCPTSTGWLASSGYLESPEMWLCPNDARTPGTFTFSYTLNGRTGIRCGLDGDTSKYYTETISGTDFISPRALGTFANPSATILMCEENTHDEEGKIIINDARFIYEDSSDHRHFGEAASGYLDGHAGMIPSGVSLWENRDYWFCSPDDS